MIANGPQYSLLGRPGLGDRFGLHTILAFFSNRVLRGGPKILLNLATCLVALIIITKLLPSRMTDIAFGPTYGSIWHDDSKTGKGPSEKQDVGGGLRIVVFGESDIATPSLTGSEMDGELLTWTESLCAELGCSKHLSFVPRADPLESPMTSNSFYAAAVERVLNETADSTMPALDYTFVPDLFPIKWDIPDLAMQVSNFLSMEKPEKPPTETIWVFSFGPWDIWSLATLPISVGKSITDTITTDIFTHVERLYTASRDENSIAYSNYFDETVVAALANGTSVNNTDATIQNRAEYPNVRPTVEPFRIIIPKVFDPSALPGWWDSRPPIASIHSKAEQMKHAAELTEYWNNNLHNGLAQWILTATQNMEKEKAEGEKTNGNSQKSGSEKEPIEEKRRRAATISAPKSEASAAALAKSRDALRDGIAYDMPDYVLAVMADRQMRNSDLKDSNGMGESPVEDSFLEVWTPCIQPAHPVPIHRVNPSDITINVKHDKPKMDKPKSKDESKKEEVDKKPKEKSDDKNKSKGSDKKEDLPGEKKDEGRQEASSGHKQRRDSVPIGGDEVETTENKELQSQSAVGRVCPEPNDHLFYTSFALSQRAIQYIAKEVADMVRYNETVRRQWSREDARANNDGNEHH
ncbi:hypothetical protein UCRPA7_4249 [Phaeoacremonium minimum UCRPA7]|uniref:Uncharacterized protein n=1 Tax=Phaeoacremonium minimum (strain UCR-PA7) TaxID=1286976 RepID=R8BLT1_PHAM7|nr:hypothetical protein UCRPA7_4249 [Phaeoacremonium minimum UCRPA7]EOO00331.1 hypothetical protein UCRPA7_4249 [Phaeoacremonium minimum UCRPA7]